MNPTRNEWHRRWLDYRQLAEQNRLTAVQIAMESARRKRELAEQAAHRTFVEAGGTSLLTVPVPRVQATVPASGVQR